MKYNGNVVQWWVPGESDASDAEDIKAARAGALLEETALIEQRQSAWHELALWNATLYTNRELPGFRWGDLDATTELWPTNLRTENIIAEVGAAMLSKASSSPLKPSMVPHGTSYRTERAVRLTDNFLFGVWRQTKAEDACVRMFDNAYWAGLGCVQVSFDKRSRDLHVENVFPDCVVVDNRECQGANPPRTFRIRKVMSRADVEAKYSLTLGTHKLYHQLREIADGWVVVVEAFRLPGPDGKGGRHTVAACDQLLVDEDWKHSWVPLVFFHWEDRTSGFFTRSGVESLVPFQVRQDELNVDIKDAQDISCRPRLKVNANTHIDVNHWDSVVGRMLMWSGMEPEPLVWPTNLQELYAERDRNRASAFSHVGLSEMFANADIPQGVRLDSSAGVREFRNLEDGRHLRRWTNFEAARLAVARTILNVLSISKGADAFTTVYHPAAAKASAKMIPYEAVREVTEDQFTWTMEAVPLSQMSPAARRELIRDWTSRGLVKVGSDEARRMEGNPNLERLEDLELAAADDILRHLEILEDGDYEAPNELTDTVFGVKKVTANYHRLKRYEDVPEEVLDNHIRWIVAAVAIQQAAVAPPADAQMSAFSPTQGVAGTTSAMAPGPQQFFGNQPGIG